MGHPSYLGGSTGSPPASVVLTSGLVLLAILAIDVKLISYCLDDLSRRAFVAGGDKRFWAAVIIVGGPVGQLLYWLYGRGEG